MANLGRVGIVPKGAYSAAAEYRKLDLVTDGGEAYLYVSDTPTTGTALTAPQWLKIAEKGTNGTNGASAYDQAVTGGYTGTLSEFYADLAALDNLAAELAGV